MEEYFLNFLAFLTGYEIKDVIRNDGQRTKSAETRIPKTMEEKEPSQGRGHSKEVPYNAQGKRRLRGRLF